MIKFKKLFALVLVTINCITYASTVIIPNTFTANTPAVASQVNANFNAVKTSVDDNNTNITDLMAMMTQMQNQINQLQADLTTANNKIAALESNTVLELDGFLRLSSLNGFEVAEFTNINVQINDGSGDTDGVVNGKGNLIIGYDETSNSEDEFCSDPLYETFLDCFANDGTWGRSIRSGSHNLVMGMHNSYREFSGIVAGIYNVINSPYASVLGGRRNQAHGFYSAIVSGENNKITITQSDSSAILGGNYNKVRGKNATISGGVGGYAVGKYSSIAGGGYYDEINNIFEGNSAYGLSSTVCGGRNNSAFTQGVAGTVVGGDGNTTVGVNSTAVGGYQNQAQGLNSTLIGN